MHYSISGLIALGGLIMIQLSLYGEVYLRMIHKNIIIHMFWFKYVLSFSLQFVIDNFSNYLPKMRLKKLHVILIDMVLYNICYDLILYKILDTRILWTNKDFIITFKKKKTFVLNEIILLICWVYLGHVKDWTRAIFTQDNIQKQC